MKRSQAFMALALACAEVTAAQQTGQNKDAADTDGFAISVQSNLVVEAVTVKDKQGHFIFGLTAKDFILSEDDKPQTIRHCEYQNLAEESKPLAPLTEAENTSTIYKKLIRTQIAPEPENKARYKDHRLLTLYFDMSSLGDFEKIRATEAALKFVRTQLTSVDMVAIMRFDGSSVDILQDFTADRNRLLSILQTLIVGENSKFAEENSSSDTGADAAFGQNDAEFNMFNTDRQLAALQTAVQMLGHLNEKKTLIYFASGLALNGIDNQAQMHATTDAAIRAGVVLWAIDARGLVASAPIGDASQASSGGQSMYTGEASANFDQGFSHSQESLYTLATDTGGKAFLDNNDLARGIVQAQQSISDYYIISYYTTNTDLNGKFRRIRIELANRQDAKLDYRNGYFAGKEFKKFNDVDRERQLEEALMLEDPITELTIAMEIDYFQLNRAEYFTPIVVKIPGRELALAKRKGANYTHIDFIGEIKDLAGGETVTNMRDSVNIKLSDATAAELVHRPIEYDTGYTLLPGDYSIKFLARDDETGRIGTFQTNFTIPNLAKVKDRVPISAVVLSSQRVDLKDALYDAEKTKTRAKDEAFDPLVQDGKKLIPSVTRVFTTGHKITVFFLAYKEKNKEEESAAATTSKAATTNIASPTPLYAFATLYQNGKSVYECQPKAITQPADNSFSKLPFSFEIDHDKLPRGRYELQITVLDPAKQQSSTWRTQVMLAE
jgi:VWFA-related protein